MFAIEKSFRFEAAHLLPNVPEGHKCRRLHGHSFRVDVRVAGPLGAQTGWVADYSDLSKAFRPVHDALDHRYLNDVEGLENPTSEAIAGWIWKELAPRLPGLARVVVHETCTSRCVYDGPDGGER
ncbi:MAG: 6-carboxytetrahydropterin synthase QueD [Gemmatimonadota bacterium]|jgi:6-pyruvoyltetrahydropterin/6-carboxytetrahydropterin synthase|nr:6-carboxytetrahydropterin synthase QueD [Gemmatimonadota bacterium]MDP6529248.1 6-carboxytetrahydropterin synthase QueD [Gemmatimonadota bacterium]MDP6802909.1 6-carboxytetrahydropterin synthase QueD [Gemmatimonadota bacterium]MDP7031421.1 6-carboxytetrahydropterin synthase QueD [Gemmatimonadota bacterium]